MKTQVKIDHIFSLILYLSLLLGGGSKKRSRTEANISDETIKEFSFHSKHRKTNQYYNLSNERDERISLDLSYNKIVIDKENSDPNFKFQEITPLH